MDMQNILCQSEIQSSQQQQKFYLLISIKE